MARNLILNNPKHIRIPTPLNDDVAFSFFDFYLAQETIFPSPLPSRPIGSRRTFLLTVMWYITTHVSLVCSLFFCRCCRCLPFFSLSLGTTKYFIHVEMPERRQWKGNLEENKNRKKRAFDCVFCCVSSIEASFSRKMFSFPACEKGGSTAGTIPANREKSWCALPKSIKRQTIKAPLGAY